MSNRRTRFSLVLALLSTATFAHTLVWPQWVEGIFGVEPDGGDGSFELLLFLALGLVTAAAWFDVILAWIRRLRSPASAPIDPTSQ